MTIRTFLLASLLAPALALAAQPADVVTPQRDMTIIKTAQGDITLLHTMIGMNSAHDVELISFFKRAASGPAEQIAFEQNGDYNPTLPVRHGADCAMTGVRVLQDGKRLRVVYASRKGDWFDKKPFNFSVFELTAEEGGMPGTPSLYFAEKSRVVSKTAYCDAGMALDKEAALYRGGAN